MLTIRIEEAVKSELERAASASGRSLSAFVVEAAQRAAAKIPSERPETASRRGGVPRWFAAMCETAESGGSFGYEQVGFKFSGGLDSEMMLDHEDSDERLAELAGFCKANEPDEIVAWFDRNFGKAMELVPVRRRPQFAEGVIRRWSESDTDWACAR